MYVKSDVAVYTKTIGTLRRERVGREMMRRLSKEIAGVIVFALSFGFGFLLCSIIISISGNV